MCISRITYTALGKRAEVLSSHQSGAGEDGRGSLHGDERVWQEADLQAVGSCFSVPSWLARGGFASTAKISVHGKAQPTFPVCSANCNIQHIARALPRALIIILIRSPARRSSRSLQITLRLYPCKLQAKQCNRYLLAGPGKSITHCEEARGNRVVALATLLAERVAGPQPQIASAEHVQHSITAILVRLKIRSSNNEARRRHDAIASIHARDIHELRRHTSHPLLLSQFVALLMIVNERSAPKHSATSAFSPLCMNRETWQHVMSQYCG
ncbi:hypothetical protein KC350_g66 [Hortaea werneckii]|nr:hypothetical protein KC350_g66 [Hortaea werneckii]